jgi:phage terminase large subunit-like protein
LLASKPEGARQRILSTLSDDQVQALRYDWRFWGRPSQFAPDDPDWLIWLLMTGRGFGKTRSGAEFINERAFQGGKQRWIALIGATPADVRDYQIERGPSAILRVSPPWFRPAYFPSKRLLLWPNGAHATVFSGEKPEGLRGFSGDTAWGDEFAKWRHPEEALDNLLFGMREAKVSSPQICLTTTPKPLAILKELVKDPDVRTIGGTSYENRENLDPRWFAKVIAKVEGTSLGLQEVQGKLLDEMPGAKWKRAWIDDHRHQGRHPDLLRIVVAVDPPGSSRKGGAECGILVGGIARLAGVLHGFVLEDGTLRATPAYWGRAAVRAFWKWRADRLVAEKNYGGEMVEHTIRTVPKDDEARAGLDVAYKHVSATRGKVVRAEPIAALYEKGRIHHCGAFPALEDELCTWEDLPGEPSPNRLDALVWCFTELLLEPEPNLDIRLPVLRRPT